MASKQKKNGGRKAGAKAKAERKASKAGKRTIKAAVIEIFSANPGATNAELTEAIKAEFPESAFKASHASWYRQQLKKGKLTKNRVPTPPRSQAPAAPAAAATDGVAEQLHIPNSQQSPPPTFT